MLKNITAPFQAIPAAHSKDSMIRILGLNHQSSSHLSDQLYLQGIGQPSVSLALSVWSYAWQLGQHKHLSTTQRYFDVNKSKLRGAIELIKSP